MLLVQHHALTFSSCSFLLQEQWCSSTGDTHSVRYSLPALSHSALAQCKASSSVQCFNGKDKSCFAKNALVLINDCNLSADSQPAFQSGSGWQHPSPVWVTWWCGLANTARLRWRDEEGEYRSSISKVLSLPKSLPGWDRGWATSYIELGPCLGRKKAKKTVTKMNQLFNKVVFFPLDTINTGSDVPQPPKYSPLSYQEKFNVWAVREQGKPDTTGGRIDLLSSHDWAAYWSSCLLTKRSGRKSEWFTVPVYNG